MVLFYLIFYLNLRFFTTDSDAKFLGEQLRMNKFFIDLDPQNLSDTAVIVDALNLAYETDKSVWPSFQLGEFNSHRIKSLYASNLFRLAHGLVLLIKGTPVVLYGDEIELQGRNELENTMQFEKTIGCGFTESQDIAEYFEKSTSCQNVAYTDLKKMYADLRKIREEVAFSTGDLIMLEVEGVVAFIRKVDNSKEDKYLVLVNTEDRAIELDLSRELVLNGEKNLQGSIVYYYSVDSRVRDMTEIIGLKNVRVGPGEILVLKLVKQLSENEFD